jgi:hypothetical protein
MCARTKNVVLASLIAIALGATAFASNRGSGGGGGGDSPTGTGLTLSVLDEMAPPGGMVQMKVRTTEVTPISGGRTRFAFDPAMFAGAAGFSMFATGELAGAAVINGAQVAVSYTTNGALTADSPILTVTLRIRPDVAVGARTLFTFDPQWIWIGTPAGPVQATQISPGTVTVGGAVSITDVVPGEGVWPAGTVVSVKGIGFSSRTRLRVNDIATSAVRLVSQNEMQFTLAQATQLRGVRLRADDPANRDTYYAYMRGITSTVSSRTLLAATYPIFAVTPRAVATLGPLPSLSANQYAGVALQNPNATNVSVGIALYEGGALTHRAVRTLQGRQRLAMEISELLDGVAPSPGSSVVVSASAPIDAIGLLCDEGSWTVSPSLPLESQR